MMYDAACVVVDDLPQLFEAPVVHVGKAVAEVAQRRYLEMQAVFTSFADLPPAEILKGTVNRQTVIGKFIAAEQGF